jgi:hypothetical protein
MSTFQETDRKVYTGRQAPTYLTRLLTRIGGLNVFDEPHFRLVWAEDRLTPSGGVWLNWLPGTSLADRNRSKGKRPWSRSIGVRMIKRYGPAQGWLLERWVPARAYGSRERWNAPAIVGGTILIIPNGAGLTYMPSQGAYPSRGDYEYTGFAFTNYELAEATVVPCMQALIREVEEMPTNPERRVAIRAGIARQAAEAADAEYESWALEVVHNRQPAFNGAAMSGAGTKRPHSSATILKRLGIKSHHIS